MTEIDIMTEDMEFITNTSYIPWSKLKNKTIYITGGTGLIGSILIKVLLMANKVYELNLKILALVRSVKKAKQVLGSESAELTYVVGSVENSPVIEETIDFIVHGASPTASNYFVNYPVELIEIAVRGTTNILKLAKEKSVQSMTYLSSMEVYGSPHDENKIDETRGIEADSMVVRNCYPLSKRLCENLCASYANEYGVYCNVVRLAQTFGPGVLADDQRLFSEIARAVINNQDIILQTTGTSKRCYLYTVDAITAILMILLTGKSGEAYNAANPSTYSSIVDMANMVVREIAQNAIQLHVPFVNTAESHKYPPNHYLNLDVSKLESLGWKPTVGIKEMFTRTIDAMKKGYS